MVIVENPDLAPSGGLALNPWSQLTLTDRDLAWGDYLVEEVTPPTGYDLSDPAVHAFTVDATNLTLTYTFENPRQTGTVTWSKVDAGNALLLAGSEWALTGPDVPADTVVVDCVEEPCSADPFTDQDPMPGQFELTGLIWGEYTLVESSAPPGYIVDTTPRQFQVNADNVGAPIVIGPFDNVPVTPPTIPLTGGISRDFYTLAGLLVLSLGIGGLGVRRLTGRKEVALAP